MDPDQKRRGEKEKGPYFESKINKFRVENKKSTHCKLRKADVLRPGEREKIFGGGEREGSSLICGRTSSSQNRVGGREIFSFKLGAEELRAKKGEHGHRESKRS